MFDLSVVYASHLGNEDSQQLEKAESFFREYLDLLEEGSIERWQYCDAQSVLGQILLAQEKSEEAEPLLMAGYRGLNDSFDVMPAGSRKKHLRRAIKRLIDLHRSREDDDEVERLKRELEMLKKRDADN